MLSAHRPQHISCDVLALAHIELVLAHSIDELHHLVGNDHRLGIEAANGGIAYTLGSLVQDGKLPDVRLPYTLYRQDQAIPKVFLVIDLSIT
jgi:hypothetical protein